MKKMKFYNGKCYSEETGRFYETTLGPSENDVKQGEPVLLFDLNEYVSKYQKEIDPVASSASLSKEVKTDIGIDRFEIYGGVVYFKFRLGEYVMWWAYDLLNKVRIETFSVKQNQMEFDRAPQPFFQNGYMFIIEITANYAKEVSMRLSHLTYRSFAGNKASDNQRGPLQAPHSLNIKAINLSDKLSGIASVTRSFPTSTLFKVYGDYIVTVTYNGVFYQNYVDPNSQRNGFKYDDDPEAPQYPIILGNLMFFFKKLKMFIVDLNAFQLIAKRMLVFPDIGDEVRKIKIIFGFGRTIFFWMFSENNKSNYDPFFTLSFSDLGLSDKGEFETKPFSLAFASTNELSAEEIPIKDVSPVFRFRRNKFSNQDTNLWYQNRLFMVHPLGVYEIDPFTIQISKPLQDTKSFKQYKLEENSTDYEMCREFQSGWQITSGFREEDKTRFNRAYRLIRKPTVPESRPLVFAKDFLQAFVDTYDPILPMTENAYYAPLMRLVSSDTSNVECVYELMRIVENDTDHKLLHDVLVHFRIVSDSKKIKEVD